MSPDVTRAKKQQNPNLLPGRHVPIPHASDTVVGLLLGWIGNDVLAGYCKATHGCCMGACRKYFFGRMFWVTWDIREQTMFPCEQANATIHPCLYKVSSESLNLPASTSSRLLVHSSSKLLLLTGSRY